MLLDCAEQERDRAIANGFLGSSNSSSVQQVQLPYARSHSFFDQKSSSSSSTATWRRGRSTRRSLLLRVCVHTQFHLPKKTTSFAVDRTSTQSALDGNGGGTQRSRQLSFCNGGIVVVGWRSMYGCNGAGHSAIEHFWMESEPYKICEGWAT